MWKISFNINESMESTISTNYVEFNFPQNRHLSTLHCNPVFHRICLIFHSSISHIIRRKQYYSGIWSSIDEFTLYWLFIENRVWFWQFGHYPKDELCAPNTVKKQVGQDVFFSKKKSQWASILTNKAKPSSSSSLPKSSALSLVHR